MMLKWISGHHARCISLVIMLEVELTPFTQNDHYLKSKEAAWLAFYKDVCAGRTSGTKSVCQSFSKMVTDENYGELFSPYLFFFREKRLLILVLKIFSGLMGGRASSVSKKRQQSMNIDA
jgi:hypothetical protein